ncbi:MAG: threonine-phosphate decarboxylase CobD [Leptolyngbyaceae cyanobacterium bins.302]|nr:threonine-phosphate decarboxylase CobD [Leptolyngbyaceae cyanobacterium bins.302]
MHSNRPLHGGNLVWAAELANCSPDAILDFSASINPLGPPASAIAAIQAHLADLKAYPDPNYTQLRHVLSQFHQVPPEWILPGNGSAELLTWACRDLAREDVTCLMTPAFGDYFRALKTFDARVIKCAIVDESALEESGSFEDFYLLDLEGFEAQLDRLRSDSDIAIGLLLNNPHNPSGTLFLKEQLLQYLETVALLVVDEAFMDFVLPDQQQSLIDLVQEYPNLVVLRSLTKFYSLPGLRLGYAIAHPDRLQRWQAWRDPWSVNSLAAAVGEVVLQDTSFQQQTWEWLTNTRPVLYDKLTALPELKPYPGEANFLLVHSDRSVTQIQAELLKRHQILIRDCLSFPELGDRYFRVAIRTPEDNQQFVNGLIDVLQPLPIA